MTTQELIVLLERLSLDAHYGGGMKDHHSVRPGHLIAACTDDPCPAIRDAVASVGAIARDLDVVYTERNAVVAALLRVTGWPCWLVNAPDAAGWYIVYASTPEGQVSWHVSERDVHLFEMAPLLAAGFLPWDGHSTEEKYKRLAALRREQP